MCRGETKMKLDNKASSAKKIYAEMLKNLDTVVDKLSLDRTTARSIKQGTDRVQ